MMSPINDDKHGSHAMWKWIILGLLIGVTACVPSSATPTPSPVPIEDTPIQVQVDGIAMALRQPIGWDVTVEGHHIYLSEESPSIDDYGHLHGISTHIWIPTIDEFPIEYNPTQHTVSQILSLVQQSDKYGSKGYSTEPVSFTWSDHDSAFYTLNHGDGNVTLVLMVLLPHQNNHLLAVNISAPYGHKQRIRDVLLMVFDDFWIDHIQFDVQDLASLGEPLAFPETTTPESTAEAS